MGGGIRIVRTCGGFGIGGIAERGVGGLRSAVVMADFNPAHVVEDSSVGLGRVVLG